MTEEPEIPHQNGRTSPTKHSANTPSIVKSEPLPNSMEDNIPAHEGVNGDHTNSSPQDEDDSPSIPLPLPLHEHELQPDDLPPPPPAPTDFPPPPPTDFPQPTDLPLDILPPPPARIYSDEQREAAALRIQKAWRKHNHHLKKRKAVKSVFANAPVSSNARLVAATKERTKIAGRRKAPTRGKKIESKVQTVPDRASEIEDTPLETPEASNSSTSTEEEKPAAPRRPPVGGIGLGIMPKFNPAAIQLKAAPKRELSLPKENEPNPIAMVKLKSAPARPTPTGSLLDVSATRKAGGPPQGKKAASAFFVPPPRRPEEESKPDTETQSAEQASAPPSVAPRKTVTPPPVAPRKAITPPPGESQPATNPPALVPRVSPPPGEPKPTNPQLTETRPAGVLVLPPLVPKANQPPVEHAGPSANPPPAEPSLAANPPPAEPNPPTPPPVAPLPPTQKKKGLFGWLSVWLGKRPSKQELIEKNILPASPDDDLASFTSSKERKKKEKEAEKERKKQEKEKKKQEKQKK